jgi:hypothetical protein
MMMNAACRREQERTRHNEQHDPKDSASGKCLTFGEDSRQAEEDRGEGDSSRALAREAPVCSSAPWSRSTASTPRCHPPSR